MTIELNLANLIFIVIASTSGIWALMKIIASQNQRYFSDRFSNHEKSEFEFHAQMAKRLDGIEASNRIEASQWQRVERELLTLKADMPLHYVRREDYIRGQSILEAKMDGLATKIENAQLRGLNQALPPLVTGQGPPVGPDPEDPTVPAWRHMGSARPL